MKDRIFYDTLTVSKGPEDGMSFSITSTPLLVGRSPDCLVNLQFDVTIQPEHAILSLGTGGYRVRKASGAAVLVDGKRAGRIRSRTLENGGALRVGYTDLILRCAEGGYAATGTPTWADSDAAFAFRALAGAGRDLLELGFAHAKKAARTARVHWVWSLILLAVLSYFTIPAVRTWVGDWVTHFRNNL